MKKLQIVSMLIVISFVCMIQTASADRTIRYQNAKILGLGDTRIAGGFRYNGFTDNPALLSRVNGVRFSIVPVPVGINNDLIDIAKFINDNTDNFQNFEELSVDEKSDFIKDLEKYDGSWGRVSVLPLVDVAANIQGYGVGLAVFNTSVVGLKMDRGIYDPRVWGEGTSNTAVVLGIAKPLVMFVPGLTVGVNLKYLQRRNTDIFQIQANDLGNINDTTKPITDQFKESKHNTIAVDFGALIELPVINSEVGATYNAVGDGRGSSLDLGIAKRMYSDKLTVLADYIDFFDNNNENVFNKIHLGAEYFIFPLALRAGINSGYTTLGLGFDFKVIDIDYAFYTEEMSNGPGGNEEVRHIVQFKFGW